MKRWTYIPIAALLALILLSTEDIFVVFSYNIIEGAQVAPYQYRVLFAILFVVLSQLIGLTAATWLFWFLTLSFFALLLDFWLALWMSASKATAGTLYTLLLLMGFWWFHPYSLMWSTLEAVFWMGALLLLHEKCYGWLVPLIFLATLNRETAIFIVLLVGLVTLRWQLTAALLIVWILTYGSIRLYYGYALPESTLLEILEQNLSRGNFFHTLLGLLLFGWIPIFVARAYRSAPLFLKKAILAAPPYLAAIAVFGIWSEFRLLLPLVVLAMPLVMGVTTPEEGDLATAHDLSQY